VFVNKIVKIIHEVTKRWDGQPAKNYGEKYLLLWKMPTSLNKDGLSAALEQNRALAIAQEANQTAGGPPSMAEQFNATGKLADVNSGLLQGGDEQEMILMEMDRKAQMEEELREKRQITADKALISAVKIVVELRRASDLQAYSRHPKIQPKFSSQYRTGVTIGIHQGWAIEGAVGSDFRIDALHLSPDAMIAHRIEEFCSVYDQNILLTQDIQKLLSEKAKTTLRLIDNIVMNESQTPRVSHLSSLCA